MNVQHLTFSAVLLSMVGCAAAPPPPLSPEAAAIELSKSEPAGCTPLGEVQGSAKAHQPLDAMNRARNTLRNAALTKKASHVAIESEQSNMIVYGLTGGYQAIVIGNAYKCDAPGSSAPSGGQAALEPTKPL